MDPSRQRGERRLGQGDPRAVGDRYRRPLAIGVRSASRCSACGSRWDRLRWDRPEWDRPGCRPDVAAGQQEQPEQPEGGSGGVADIGAPARDRGRRVGVRCLRAGPGARGDGDGTDPIDRQSGRPGRVEGRLHSVLVGDQGRGLVHLAQDRVPVGRAGGRVDVRRRGRGVADAVEDEAALLQGPVEARPGPASRGLPHRAADALDCAEVRTFTAGGVPLNRPVHRPGAPGRQRRWDSLRCRRRI